MALEHLRAAFAPDVHIFLFPPTSPYFWFGRKLSNDLRNKLNWPDVLIHILYIHAYSMLILSHTGKQAVVHVSSTSSILGGSFRAVTVGGKVRWMRLRMKLALDGVDGVDADHEPRLLTS